MEAIWHLPWVLPSLLTIWSLVTWPRSLKLQQALLEFDQRASDEKERRGRKRREKIFLLSFVNVHQLMILQWPWTMTSTRLGVSLPLHAHSFSNRGDSTRLLPTQLRPAVRAGPRSTWDLAWAALTRQVSRHCTVSACPLSLHVWSLRRVNAPRPALWMPWDPKGQPYAGPMYVLPKHWWSKPKTHIRRFDWLRWLVLVIGVCVFLHLGM